MERDSKNADNQNRNMIRKLLFLSVSCLLLTTSIVPLNGYFITYKEQYYRLYHLH